ncbi:8845_t:CDS:2 [Acaulospora morrowiae]|uniref:8845_t:CDS:1 n=1 Tax=Acaulospora morrowiae TaxID=94023 RepID=A0A9N9DBT3_9GLOM|nr:8845_t:CDS:2 [Acaulospora morrowiae]
MNALELIVFVAQLAYLIVSRSNSTMIASGHGKLEGFPPLSSKKSYR